MDLSTLNEAQRAAVTAGDGPVLVIAGAGSGKTRTLVHRLAWLVEQGVAPTEMLLLTFTRKASREMLLRAQDLLGLNLGAVHGGTFHGFAYSALRQYRPAWATGPVTVMDAQDSTGVVQQCRTDLNIAKGVRAFPKAQHVLGIISKARNKEISVAEVIQRDSPHMLPFADDIQRIGETAAAYKRAHGLLDYDDLLFELEALLAGDGLTPGLSATFRERFRHVLVDEYQDTNKVQARLVGLLTGHNGNIMAVGDDAQSIYAFRGADVRNILDFPRLFPGTDIVRLEENYRSTPSVLCVANAVLANASEGYAKNLFTSRPDGPKARLLRPLSDLSQARAVAGRVEELLETYQAHEIAVLFRAGFHSYHLEVELTRKGIRFRKYGGLKYTEAAHIKDVLAFVRLIINPLDMPSFQRVAALHRGVGPRTAQKLYAAAISGVPGSLDKACAKYPALLADLHLVDSQRAAGHKPEPLLKAVIEHYQPLLEAAYPEDWPRRLQGLEELTRIASSYSEADAFVADLSLENPDKEEERENESIVLSTIHSSKGLEWDVVIILDLVEDRFPSRHAVVHPEDFEEERRLMYVACTRARERLELSAPRGLYSRQDGCVCQVSPSPFLSELPAGCCEEWQEGLGGKLMPMAHGQRSTMGGYTGGKSLTGTQRFGQSGPERRKSGFDDPDDSLPVPPKPVRSESNVFPTSLARQEPADPAKPVTDPGECGYCRHRIFGRGKVVEHLPPDKCRVNFPGLGLKVIIRDFLQFEEE